MSAGDGQSSAMTRDLSPSQRAFIASSVRSAVDLTFAHWEGVPAGLDLDARYRELLDATIAKGDRNQFALEMAAFLASLRNGHTAFWDLEGWKSLGGTLGFRAQPLGSQWVLTKAWRSGLHPGMVLERVNGRTPEDLYSELRRYVPASSESAARRHLFGLTHLFPRKLSVQVDGRTRTYARVPGKGNPPPERTTGKWLRRGLVGYIRVPSFGDPVHERKALDLARRFRSGRSLILDVRGNTGGSTPQALLSALMERPWRGMAVSTPQRTGMARAYAHLLDMLERGEGKGLHLTRERLAPLEYFRELDRGHLLFPGEPHEPQRGAYRGTLVVLVDGGCGSACEDLLVPLKETGRATLVGTTTGGSTGQPFILDFKEGVRAFVGTKRCYFPDGRPFEGVGIAPDREVVTTREALLASRDPVLELARELVDSEG